MKYLQQTYKQKHAPEFYGDFWFNSDPIALQALRGRPVLLFFWDYTSPQSLRLLSLIKEIQSLYEECGLVFIGIHSPEFFFGKDPQKVEHSIKKLKISFPVLTDNDRLVTDAYRISSIPSICLIDNKGDIYDIASSDIVVERVERSVQYLLRQSGYYGELPMLFTAGDDDFSRKRENFIPEIYTGYSHGSLGNPEGYSPELPAEYDDPKIHIRGKFYAHGIWIASKNFFSYQGLPYDGYIVCESKGEHIDVLMGSDRPASVRIEMNDEPLKKKLFGNDVRMDKKGNPYVDLHEPKLHSVMKNNSEFQSLKLIPSSAGVTFYMFAFGSKQHSSIKNDDSDNGAL